MTVVVASGRAERWQELSSVLMDDGSGAEPAGYEVETVRAYRDRLILKLKGVDDPGQAAGLKGHRVLVPGEAVPELPDGEYFLDHLIGMTVREQDEELGKVTDVQEAGGTHVLVVETGAGGELLIPLVKAMVQEVDDNNSSIHVVLPPGLKELEDRKLP